ANQSDQYFFNPDFSTKLHQLRQSADKSLSTRNSLRFNEPLSETLNLTSTLDVSYFKGRSALQTFHADQNGNYTQLQDDYSEDIQRHGWQNSLYGGLRWRAGAFTFTPAVNLTMLSIHNEFQSRTPIKQRYFYVQPSFSANYKVFYFSYNTFFEEPPAAYLQPV